jgi:P27 family predicted phage terminase small subunit
VTRGRKPTPTKLKILRGNPGKRAINGREPKPQGGVPPCPKVLRGEAKKEWRRVTKLLAGLGLVTHLDRSALTLYCQLWARWLEAEGKLNEFGPVIVKPAPEPKEGEEPKPPEFVPNPYLKVSADAGKQLRAMLAEFGLTPSSRSRLQTPGAGEDADPLEELMRRAQSKKKAT